MSQAYGFLPLYQESFNSIMCVQVTWCPVRAAAAFRYISDDTPMHAYLNTAFIINNRRKATRDIRPGPVVAVVGPNDCGKSSLTKILLNYAIRSGWNPLLVETDVRHGMITVPGALSAVQVCLAQTRPSVLDVHWRHACIRACPSSWYPCSQLVQSTWHNQEHHCEGGSFVWFAAEALACNYCLTSRSSSVLAMHKVVQPYPFVLHAFTVTPGATCPTGTDP